MPDDANDLRGFHFRRLLRRPVTWIATGIAVIAAGDLDTIRAASAAVATRLRDESAETG
jgi:hypothetical protein